MRIHYVNFLTFFLFHLKRVGGWVSQIEDKLKTNRSKLLISIIEEKNGNRNAETNRRSKLPCPHGP